jgi:substrate-binding family protein
VAGPAGSEPVAAVRKATGVTRGGYTCGPGVRQVPWAAYSPPCVAKFTGSNGGATYNGVTAKTIKIGVRVPVDAGGPAAQAQDRLNEQTGGASAAQSLEYVQKYLKWFNAKYEIYGRQVVLEKYNGQGNSIDEAQAKGQEAACADATKAATTVHAFSSVLYGFTEESGVFAECATRQQHMFLPLAAPYFPESYFKKWHPYAWDNTMQCERIASDLAEYTGKRLNGRNAKWAGDATYKVTKRRFALYVPNDPAYQICADVFQNTFKEDYGGQIVSRYNYALDVSQFPSEAVRAVVQFQAAQATTVILACDNISPVFLTQGAKQQDWHPEWLLIGVAGTDTDAAAQSYDQDEVDGHLFGMSQLGNTAKLISPKGEAARAWHEATGEKTLPQGAFYAYYNLVQIFSLLQASGPVLTPANAAAGIRAFPPAGGSSGAAGTWSWAKDHTATIDAREIYWDGGSGHFLETYGGKRFQSGQWPRTEPPIYPKR